MKYIYDKKTDQLIEKKPKKNNNTFYDISAPSYDFFKNYDDIRKEFEQNWSNIKL